MVSRPDISFATTTAEACPSPDTLALLATGDLPVGERQKLVDHLVACATCAEDYRLAESLGPWAERMHKATAFVPLRRGASTPWKLALAASVLLALGAGAWAVMLREEAAALRSRITQLPSAAAIETAASAQRAAESRVARLEDELARLRLPDLNVPIIDLTPGVSRSAPQRIVARIPESARFVTLVFTLEQSSGNPLALEIESAGSVIGTWGGLQVSTFQTATAIVPAALMPLGECRVRLLDNSKVVQEYRLTVERVGGRAR
jgi:hypothetical protein